MEERWAQILYEILTHYWEHCIWNKSIVITIKAPIKAIVESRRIIPMMEKKWSLTKGKENGMLKNLASSQYHTAAIPNRDMVFDPWIQSLSEQNVEQFISRAISTIACLVINKREQHNKDAIHLSFSFIWAIVFVIAHSVDCCVF